MVLNIENPAEKQNVIVSLKLAIATLAPNPNSPLIQFFL